jgi:NADH-quinone oxidoreductase subunit L
MAFLGIVQNDIKRVVAYSTLSQLGYMTVGLGASAYAASIFHLMTHAFFKALLFLAAGSVIIALHHEQDLRKMGGLRKYLPVTFVTAWIGSLALAGIPPFAGFFSKDAIIEAVHASPIPGAGIAYVALVAGVFVTAFYSFRMLFLAFYGKPRMDEHTRQHLHESPWVITVPLIALAIPSVLAGLFFMEPLLFKGFFAESIKVSPQHNVLAHIREHYAGIGSFIGHGLLSLPFLLALAGIGFAWVCYIRRPQLPDLIQQKFQWAYTVLIHKYGFDELYDFLFAGGARKAGRLLWTWVDVRLIDGLAVNGTAWVIGWASSVVRQVQSGYIYHYAFAIILGVFLLMTFFLHR